MNIKKTAYLMITLGALSVCSVIMSLAISVFMIYVRKFIMESLYIFVLTFIVNIQAFILNRYFEKRLKKHEAEKP